MVAGNPTPGLLRNLGFQNPVDFQAGSLHEQPAIWEKLLSNVSHEHVDLVDIPYYRKLTLHEIKVLEINAT